MMYTCARISDFNFGFHLTVRGFDEWLDGEERPTLKSMLEFRVGKLFTQLELPIPLKKDHEYGFTIHEGYGKIHYGWRNSTSWESNNPPQEITLRMPWLWEQVKFKLLLPSGYTYIDNSGLKFKDQIHWHEIFNDDFKFEPKKHCPGSDFWYSDVGVQAGEIYPFTDYDGTQTEVMLCGEYREWRWRWFQWLPYGAIKQRRIEIMFKQEVGRKKESWKGGLLVTSSEWKHDETMKQAFDRWHEKWNER